MTLVSAHVWLTIVSFFLRFSQTSNRRVCSFSWIKIANFALFPSLSLSLKKATFEIIHVFKCTFLSNFGSGDPAVQWSEPWGLRSGRSVATLRVVAFSENYPLTSRSFGVNLWIIRGSLMDKPNLSCWEGGKRREERERAANRLETLALKPGQNWT